MATEKSPEKKGAGGSPVRKRSEPARPPAKKRTVRGKARPMVRRPGCVLIDGQGSCPEWAHLLADYPMIDSVQREDFPEHGASFAYLAHFYRTSSGAEECSRAQKEFRKFFRAIGYKYDYSGDYESRWFEGVGVKICDIRTGNQE